MSRDWEWVEAPAEVIDRIAPIPVVIVHGRDDHFFDEDQAWLLYRRAREPKRLLLASRFGHAEDTISISGGAAAANDKKDQGTTYVSFAKFGKLTDVAAADGLYLLWHAARGIYASFAVELSSPRDLRIDRPKEAVAPPVAQLAERAEESSSDDLDRPRNVFARISC